jgi:hypothetical protein
MLDNIDSELERKPLSTLLIASIRWRGNYSECGEALGKLYAEFGR